MGVAPAAVVEPLDVVEDVGPGLRPGAIPTPVHAFAFQQAKETLRNGVIVTTAHGAHAAHDAVSGVVSEVIVRVIRIALVGMVGGVIAAVALTRLMQGMLYQVKPADPVTFAGMGLLLVAVVLVAGYIPARRAARVDPTIALRAE